MHIICFANLCILLKILLKVAAFRHILLYLQINYLKFISQLQILGKILFSYYNPQMLQNNF